MTIPVFSLTEQRVVVRVVAGRSLGEITAAVGLDERTVVWHLARAVRKLDQVSALERRADAGRGSG